MQQAWVTSMQARTSSFVYVTVRLNLDCKHTKIWMPAGHRRLLQSGSGAGTVDTGPKSGLPDLTAVEAVAMLCARNLTAVQYVTALNERYVSGGYSCNNPWITYNISKVQARSAACRHDCHECSNEIVGYWIVK